MKYTDSYDDRQSVPDMGDEAMQQYLKDAGLVEFKDWLKIRTDPKENKRLFGMLPMFFLFLIMQ